MEAHVISLKEDLSGRPRGDCKTCLATEECSGWWRKDVEQNGATCCKRSISEKEARRAMHFVQA